MSIQEDEDDRDRTPKVVSIARLSSANQDPSSIDDQLRKIDKIVSSKGDNMDPQ